MSNLSQIKADSNWGDASNTINTNFQNMDVELEKLKNSTTKFKGYFTSESNLKNKFPSPKRGDIAFVGEPYPGNVYDVLTDGSWHNTTKAPETGSVDLQDYVTKDDFEASQKEQDNKLTELEYLKSELQKVITFKEIPFISLDYSPNALYPNNSESSASVGVICTPLRNTKYRYSLWQYDDNSYIRYYKGNVNTDAVCVYSDDIKMSSRTEFVTPDVDFDFAVINLRKPLSLPIKSFYALSITTSDIEDAAITEDKIADAAVTKDKVANGIISKEKTDYHLSLFEYCLTAGYEIIPEENRMIDLSDDDDAWESGLLKIDGTIATGEGLSKYSVSKFIDYAASYSQPFTLLYCNLGTEVFSENIYANIAFYDKETHKFIAAYSCVPNKRCILIPRGYSVRVSRNNSDRTLKYSKGLDNYRYLLESFLTTEQITNTLNTNYNQDIVPLLKNKSEEDIEMSNSEVLITEENVVSIDSLRIWNDYGGKVDSDTFSTFRYKIPTGYTHVDLSNYNVGVYNGAFIDESDKWISSISNSNGLYKISIPENSYYVDVSFRASSGLNKSIIFKHYEKGVKLPFLLVEQSQVIGNSGINNQWAGKKICIIGTSVAFGSQAKTAYAKIASERLGFDIVPAGVPGQALNARIDEEHGDILAPLTYGSTCLSKAEYEAAKLAGASNITIAESPKPVDGNDWRPGDDSNYNSYYRTWENLFTEENKDVALWIYAVIPNSDGFYNTDWDNFDKDNWSYNDGKGFEEHRTTFLGALIYLMDKMYAFNPNARMVLCIDSNFNYKQGKEAFMKVSEQWNIPIIDLWGKINTSPKSLQVVKSEGGTNPHPSTFGQERLGDIFTNELLLIS